MKNLPLALALLSLSAVAALPAAEDAAAAALQKRFETPASSARPMVRWWWFGPSVTTPQLEREMNFMKEGGWGGFEVQPTYPLAVDDAVPGLKNLKLGSPEFLDALKFTAAKAKELGLRMDLTLGSGWPYGGPQFTRAEAVTAIKAGGTATVTPGQTTVAAPAGGGAGGARRGGGGGGGSLTAAILGPIANPPPGTSPYLALELRGNTAVLPADLKGATQVTFYNNGSPGLTQVKRPAFGGDGPIIDHYSPTSVAKFISLFGEPEIAACGPNPPYAIFCDSLEVVGEDWTPNFLAEFKARRGYDLTPWLPALFGDTLPKSAEIRHDWGQTLSELFSTQFNDAFKKLAASHGSKFRIQGYGSPAASLASYGHADLPEGEGTTWRAFSNSRWASSAAHMMGQPVTSSETWTWLHQAVFVANPLDMKAEADIYFLQGVNQMIAHGWPYTSENIPYPGWRFYAAAVFNEKNPWYVAMPDVTQYVGRVSAMLREGVPANDVLLYLPESDGWAGFAPGRISMSDAMGRVAGPYVGALLDWGFNLDGCDDGLLDMHGKVEGGAIKFGDNTYKVVVLPAAQRVPPSTMKKLEQFAQGGGLVIAVGNAPTLAPGFLATDEEQKTVRDIAARLFTAPGAKGLVVATPAAAGEALYARLKSDVEFSLIGGAPDAALGFVHRRVAGAEIYFLANTANTPKATKATFRVAGMTPEWWNPLTGRVTPAAATTGADGRTTVDLSLAAYGSQLLVFTKRALPPIAAAPATPSPAPLDLSAGWNVTFKNANPAGKDPAPARLDAGTNWAADPARQYFSGLGTYVKQVTLPTTWTDGRTVKLAFNGGSAPAAGAAGGRGAGSGTRANYNAPVREAAVVYVNGTRAGAAWCPPYQVELTGLLKPGVNEIKIVVGNLATNDVATPGHWNIDTRALDATFGNRFQAQGMNLVVVYPAGITGTVQLLAGNP